MSEERWTDRTCVEQGHDLHCFDCESEAQAAERETARKLLRLWLSGVRIKVKVGRKEYVIDSDGDLDAIYAAAFPEES
jgi:hypothetical protein